MVSDCFLVCPNDLQALMQPAVQCFVADCVCFVHFSDVKYFNELELLSAQITVVLGQMCFFTVSIASVVDNQIGKCCFIDLCHLLSGLQVWIHS